MKITFDMNEISLFDVLLILFLLTVISFLHNLSIYFWNKTISKLKTTRKKLRSKQQRLTYVEAKAGEELDSYVFPTLTGEASTNDTQETSSGKTRAAIRLLRSKSIHKPEESKTSNGYEISYNRPASKLKLEWTSKPKSVLIIKKWKDQMATAYLIELAEWLKSKHKISVFVDESATEDDPQILSIAKAKSPEDEIDFIILLGGDGTMLHLSSLFQQSVPPVVAFNLGSLGFLTPFNFKNYKEDTDMVLKGNCYIMLRLRLECTKASKTVKDDKGIHVLNEVVIDRGISPFLTNLEVYCDEKLITIVQADGVIIASSTGSTAYSLSAGGSLIHPMLPCILITAICPHTLSFRPIVLPASVTLRIQLPESSTCPAAVSFDGRNKSELYPGDSIIIRVSKWPVPTVTKNDQISEWFQAISRHLNWNKRAIQKPKPISSDTTKYNE